MSALVQFIASAALLAPLAYIFEGFKPNWTWPMVGSIVGIAVTCAGVALVAWKRDPPAPE